MSRATHRAADIRWQRRTGATRSIRRELTYIYRVGKLERFSAPHDVVRFPVQELSPARFLAPHLAHLRGLEYEQFSRRDFVLECQPTRRQRRHQARRGTIGRRGSRRVASQYVFRVGIYLKDGIEPPSYLAQPLLDDCLNQALGLREVDR